MGIFEDNFEKALVQFDDDDLISPSEYDENNLFWMYSIYESSSEEDLAYKINDSENIFSENNSLVKNTDISSEKKIGKKRGRKSLNEEKIKKIHNKHKNDNRLRTIQVHYFNFLIPFLNQIMNNLGLNYTFLDVAYKYKNNIKKENREKLESKTIKEILLEAPISKKYKNSERNQNKSIIEILEKNYPYMLNLLDKKYLFLFDNVYIKNLKIINLELFNLNYKEIEINNVHTFKDIFKEENIDLLYKIEMEKTVKNYFLKKVEV